MTTNKDIKLCPNSPKLTIKERTFIWAVSYKEHHSIPDKDVWNYIKEIRIFEPEGNHGHYGSGIQYDWMYISKTILNSEEFAVSDALREAMITTITEKYREMTGIDITRIYIAVILNMVSS